MKENFMPAAILPGTSRWLDGDFLIPRNITRERGDREAVKKLM